MEKIILNVYVVNMNKLDLFIIIICMSLIIINFYIFLFYPSVNTGCKVITPSIIYCY